MVPLDMTEDSLQKEQDPYVASRSCPRCRMSVLTIAPTPAEVPDELRGLSTEAALALSPLEVDAGPEIRAQHNTGYRQQRFRWAEKRTKERIDMIEDWDMWEKAKAAR
eukprot:6474834-Amphidinium_carterae.1